MVLIKKKRTKGQKDFKREKEREREREPVAPYSNQPLHFLHHLSKQQEVEVRKRTKSRMFI
jgi:hypothetical protein